MRRIILVTIPALLLIIILSACALSLGSPATAPTIDVQSQVDAAIAATSAAQTQVAFAVQQTVAAGNQGAAPPADTQGAPPPQSTNTPDKVTVTVSIATNCRTGPGTVYDLIGALAVGQSAEVVGRSHNNDNWIIKLPSNPAVTCWLWAQYATTTGDTSKLPIMQPPPTPTPSLAQVTIQNNSGTTICYMYIALTSDPSWGGDELSPDTIPPGSSYTWNYEPGVYDLKAEDCGHGFLYTWWSVDLFLGVQTTLTYP